MVAVLFQVFLRDLLCIFSSFNPRATPEGEYYDFHFVNMSISSGRSSDLSKAPKLVIGRGPATVGIL